MAITSGNVEVDKLIARRQGKQAAPTVSKSTFAPGSADDPRQTLGLTPSKSTFAPGSATDPRITLNPGLATAPPVTGGASVPGAPAPIVGPAATVGGPEGAAGTAGAPGAAAGAPAAVEGPGDAFQGFTEADIAAAMQQIEAEYGLSREELLRDQTMIGAQYRLLQTQLARQRQQALEGAEAGALQRGLFRSGIYAKEYGQVSQTYTDEQATLASQQVTELGPLGSELETWDARKDTAKAAKTGEIRRQEYEARLSAAGV